MRTGNARTCPHTHDARGTRSLRSRYARDTFSNISQLDRWLLNVLKCCCRFLEGSWKNRTFAASSTPSNTMKQAKATREEAIQAIAGMLHDYPFTFEIKAVKRPRGVRVIYEATQEQIDNFMNHQIEKNHENK